MHQPAHASTAQEILEGIFGYHSFRGLQEEIIDHVVGGGDALVLMPTGGGKSLCYQIPALVRPGTGVVVSPLIALMQDQVGALRQLGVRAAHLSSALGLDEVFTVERALQNGELDLLYVAPERAMTTRFLELLDRVQVALFAIDESHCVSHWGHQFRPEYQQLAVLAERFPGVPRIACTATADATTRSDIVRGLSLPDAQLFIGGFDRPNIFYRVVPKLEERSQLLDMLRSRHADHAGIVYCRTRNRVDRIAAHLLAAGLVALPYHAGLAADERARTLRRFLDEDGVVVVATIAFGMGIDKPDVRFVAHLDVPRSLEAYYQETGRAGRDGQPAEAWMTYGAADVVQLRKLLALNSTEEQDDSIDPVRLAQWKRVEQQKLSQLLGFCETATCRRRVLLSYFGEHRESDCGACDTCLEPVETWDGTVAAQKALSCAFRTGQRFGAQHLVDVLLGVDGEKIQRNGHHLVSTFGIGEELSRRQWLSVIRQLVAAGFLDVSLEHGSLYLTEASRPVLRGETTVMLRRDPDPPARTRKRRVKRTRAAPIAASPEGDHLFERLRALRRELAKAQGVPPYVIFHDSTLEEMAHRSPRTLDDLAGISGVGLKKLERYGEAFLGEINRAGESAPDRSPDA